MKKTTLGNSRRNFLKNSSYLSLGKAAVKTSGLLGLAQASQALAAEDDYKALVYVFLAGGNDCFNMLVPKGDSPLRTRYQDARQAVAIPSEDLHALSAQQPINIVGGEAPAAFGLHPSCGDIAQLFNQQELSFVCNIGNLISPTTREQFLNKSVALPPQLFSHSDQQRQFQSSPDMPFSHGWGGRMAELVSAHNTNSTVSPLMSVSGLNTFQVSKNNQINAYVMGNDGAVSLNAFKNERQDLVNDAMATIDSNAHLMVKKYRDIFNSANVAQTIVENAFTQAQATGVDYDAVFTAAGASDSIIARRLKTVAKMIAGKASTGNNRPIFFVEMNGFDTHQNLLSDHAELMTELNNALKGFRDVLTEQGDFDQTLTFIGSEFGRTLTPNGDDASSGTDHAWGGHAMVMGGMVNGGQFFGQHPDFKLNQGIDASTGRGRWIPTTSTTQCAAVMAHWFGIEQTQLPELFPSISNFPSPFSPEAQLNFIKDA